MALPAIVPNSTLNDADAPPTQAVIFAGGLGSRLRPLTDTLPKPMLRFDGRPFLEYLIGALREQGVRRVLLLLGYLPEVIQDYFGDGSQFGVEIDYQVSAVEDDTGRRLWLARQRLDPHFLLLYCDNYWPLDLAAMWRCYRQSGCQAQVTVYRNRDGYSRSNLRISGDGRVVLYDKSRQAEGLEGVDIGFLLLRRDVVDMLPAGGNASFEKEVYPRLVAARALSAFVTDHRYYSVGSLERLPVTAEFLRCRPTIFLDRDGTLNRRMPPGEYVRSWHTWEWLPGALQALALLHRAGWRTLVVTNQPGIARGHLTMAALEDIHRHMRDEAEAAGGMIEAVLVCPHGWDENCDCRKPRPGMLFQAQHHYHLDLTRTPLIGDDERDGAAAAAAGSPYHVLADGESLLEPVCRLLKGDWAGSRSSYPSVGLDRRRTRCEAGVGDVTIRRRIAERS
jgi:D-glycero-D-manno-heptose 1,7-bisphosphate phosphatase